MKKLSIVFLIAVALSIGTVAKADWQTTISGWTMSPGPNLNHEEVVFDGAVRPECDNILPADPKTCTFIHAQKTGQAIAIRSCDDSANCVDYSVGVLGASPNPASGTVVVNSVWIP